MTKKLNFQCLMLLMAVLVFAPNLTAQSQKITSKYNDSYSEKEILIKKRMLKRLKEIDELKLKSIIGENNKGYLQATPPFAKKLTKKQTTLVKDENKDRKEIYQIISKRTGSHTTLQKVQAIRAEMIRKKSKKSLWLQDVKGKWFRKK